MNAIRMLFASIAMLLLLAPVSRSVHAAQSYDNCNNFIDTVPATISTQGVWCLRKDLSTSIGTGAAITINANNVTIDCNDFKLGGLAAGPSSIAVGISALNRQNATIRHCNVRGFKAGILLNDGAGHLVEDNRLDNNLAFGIYILGEHNLVQRNRVFDTGGNAAAKNTFGIYAQAAIIDNVVDGVFADVGGGFIAGISASGTGARVSGNTVAGLAPTATNGIAVSNVVGINVGQGPMTIVGNSIFGPGTVGIWGWTAAVSFCSDNTVYAFTTDMGDCADDGGNGLH